MKRSILIGRTVLMAAAVTSVFGLSPASARDPLKLILQITVDQLRGDMPLRFKERFGNDGFRYLMDKGVIYTNANYGHSTTFTAVGHATLYTGGYAAQHGLAGNDWYNAATGSRVYCVEDDQNTFIGKEHKAHKGISPRNLIDSNL